MRKKRSLQSVVRRKKRELQPAKDRKERIGTVEFTAGKCNFRLRRAGDGYSLQYQLPPTKRWVMHSSLFPGRQAAITAAVNMAVCLAESPGLVREIEAEEKAKEKAKEKACPFRDK